MNTKFTFSKLLLVFAVVSFSLLESCSPCIDDAEPTATEADCVIYNDAIQYAMYPEESKVSDELIAITKENPDLKWETFDGEEYVLMVSWKGYVEPYEPYKDTGYYVTDPSYPIWVTAAPQLQERMKGEKYKSVDRRLKQLLGLPPNPANVYSDFVEFWVKPENLFRPCPDKEITDTKCNVCFSGSADSTYKAWINQSRIDRYYPCQLLDKYPWTELGYTYDWNPENKTHVGLSEFVITDSAHVKIEGIYPTKIYLNQGK